MCHIIELGDRDLGKQLGDRPDLRPLDLARELCPTWQPDGIGGGLEEDLWPHRRARLEVEKTAFATALGHNIEPASVAELGRNDGLLGEERRESRPLDPFRPWPRHLHREAGEGVGALRLVAGLGVEFEGGMDLRPPPCRSVPGPARRVGEPSKRRVIPALSLPV